MKDASENSDGAKPSAFERVLGAATRLFDRYGVHATGIDRIIADSNVAKMTFYKYFPSKADLISAYLARKHAARTEAMLRHTERASSNPRDQVLAIFDAFEEWFAEPDYSGCAFTRGLYEFRDDGSAPQLRQVADHFKATSAFVGERIRKIVLPTHAERVTNGVLALLLGSAVVALEAGNKAIASNNKLLASEWLDRYAKTPRAKRNSPKQRA